MDAVNKLIRLQEERLIRIESRLVQIMYHLGMSPYESKYQDKKPKPTDGREFQ